MHCPSERRDPAPSTRIQAQAPPTRKTSQDSNPTPSTGAASTTKKNYDLENLLFIFFPYKSHCLFPLHISTFTLAICSAVEFFIFAFLVKKIHFKIFFFSYKSQCLFPLNISTITLACCGVVEFSSLVLLFKKSLQDFLFFSYKSHSLFPMHILNFILMFGGAVEFFSVFFLFKKKIILRFFFIFFFHPFLMSFLSCFDIFSCCS